MRPLQYSINVTLDGCCDHEVIVPEEELHRYFAANLERADALLFGRLTYQIFAVFWPTAPRDEGFADRMNGIRKYVASTTLHEAPWNNSVILRRDIPPRAPERHATKHQRAIPNGGVTRHERAR
jgi:dihydrofolate reductase